MSENSPTRVLIVDDSAVIRYAVSRILAEHDDIEVVGSAINGEMAVKDVKRYDPDIVILDIEMPVMDGITALPLILKEKPDVRVLIFSALSARGAEISIRALTLGATECLLKPSGDSISSAKDFQNDLVRTVRSIFPRSKPKAVLSDEPVSKIQKNKTKISLHSGKSLFPPKIIAIGSSTGGPKVLMELLVGLKNLPVPIVITQHMPQTFTALLAEHITKNCSVPCSEGHEGDVLKPGHAYIAPGGYHMTFKKIDEGTVIHLTEDPPENFCRPSVDPMLRSLSSIYGNKILCAILTGMGSDGLKSCTDLVEQGGQVIAQNEETSIVWGMPGAVAKAGICSAVLPISGIQNWIQKSIKGQIL
jgi:two-component system chemotaxis response regulator CheB